MQLVTRIKNAAAAQGYTLADLEQKLGFGVRTIYKWDKNTPSVEKVLAVANFLNVPLSWLITGETESPKHADPFWENYKKLSKDEKETIANYMTVCLSKNLSADNSNNPPLNSIPVLGCVDSHKEAEQGKILGYQKTNLDADYALIINDYSMVPLFVPNEYVFIKQDAALLNGDIGIFHQNQSIICRQYLEHEEHIVLRPLNPDYEEKCFEKNDPAIKLIGKVLVKPFHEK